MSSVQCEPMHPDEEGWSEWIHPLPGYLMQCCDCGLIHEMEFAIGERRKGDDGPLNEGESSEIGVILFRARRYPPSDSDGSPKGGDAEGGSVRSTTARPEGIAQ